MIKNDTNEFGHGLLHKAVIHNRVDAFARLLNIGHDINEQDELGFSPLHLAALLGRVEILQLILRLRKATKKCKEYNFNFGRQLLNFQDVDVFAKTRNGQTALHLAVINGHSKSLNLLLDLGCVSSIADKNGKTALAIARKNGNMDCIVVLERQDLHQQEKNSDNKKEDSNNNIAKMDSQESADCLALEFSHTLNGDEELGQMTSFDRNTSRNGDWTSDSDSDNNIKIELKKKFNGASAIADPEQILSSLSNELNVSDELNCFDENFLFDGKSKKANSFNSITLDKKLNKEQFSPLIFYGENKQSSEQNLPIVQKKTFKQEPRTVDDILCPNCIAKRKSLKEKGLKREKIASEMGANESTENQAVVNDLWEVWELNNNLRDSKKEWNSPNHSRKVIQQNLNFVPHTSRSYPELRKSLLRHNLLSRSADLDSFGNFGTNIETVGGKTRSFSSPDLTEISRRSDNNDELEIDFLRNSADDILHRKSKEALEIAGDITSEKSKPDLLHASITDKSFPSTDDHSRDGFSREFGSDLIAYSMSPIHSKPDLPYIFCEHIYHIRSDSDLRGKYRRKSHNKLDPDDELSKSTSYLSQCFLEERVDYFPCKDDSFLSVPEHKCYDWSLSFEHPSECDKSHLTVSMKSRDEGLDAEPPYSYICSEKEDLEGSFVCSDCGVTIPQIGVNNSDEHDLAKELTSKDEFVLICLPDEDDVENDIVKESNFERRRKIDSNLLAGGMCIYPREESSRNRRLSGVHGSLENIMEIEVEADKDDQKESKGLYCEAVQDVTGIPCHCFEVCVKENCDEALKVTECKYDTVKTITGVDDSKQMNENIENCYGNEDVHDCTGIERGDDLRGVIAGSDIDCYNNLNKAKQVQSDIPKFPTQLESEMFANTPGEKLNCMLSDIVKIVETEDSKDATHLKENSVISEKPEKIEGEMEEGGIGKSDKKCKQLDGKKKNKPGKETSGATYFTEIWEIETTEEKIYSSKFSNHQSLGEIGIVGTSFRYSDSLIESREESLVEDTDCPGKIHEGTTVIGEGVDEDRVIAPLCIVNQEDGLRFASIVRQNVKTNSNGDRTKLNEMNTIDGTVAKEETMMSNPHQAASKFNDLEEAETGHAHRNFRDENVEVTNDAKIQDSPSSNGSNSKTDQTIKDKNEALVERKLPMKPSTENPSLNERPSKPILRRKSSLFQQPSNSEGHDQPCYACRNNTTDGMCYGCLQCAYERGISRSTNESLISADTGIDVDDVSLTDWDEFNSGLDNIQETDDRTSTPVAKRKLSSRLAACYNQEIAKIDGKERSTSDAQCSSLPEADDSLRPTDIENFACVVPGANSIVKDHIDKIVTQEKKKTLEDLFKELIYSSESNGHARFINDPKAVALALIKTSELCWKSGKLKKSLAERILNFVMKDVGCSFNQVLNWILVLIGLIKGEDPVELVGNVTKVLSLLTKLIKQSSFDIAHARQIAFLVSRSNRTLVGHYKARKKFLLTCLELEIKQMSFTCKYPFRIFVAIQGYLSNLEDNYMAAYQALDTYLAHFLHHENTIDFISDILIYLGLLKSEFPANVTNDSKSCLVLLTHIAEREYFPTNGAMVLRAFLTKHATQLEGLEEEKLKLIRVLKAQMKANDSLI